MSPSKELPNEQALLSTLTVPPTHRDHFLNRPYGKFTLVEYGDYECEHCLDGHHVVRELLRDLGDDFAYVFRNFPQTDIHPNAGLAAEAAEAADRQGKFWLMHDRLFEHQHELGPALIRRLAEEMSLDMHRYDLDLASGEPRRRVAEDREEGIREGVEATPTFFVNGHLHLGSYELHPLLEDLQRTAPAPD